MSAISVHIDRLRTLEPEERKVPTRTQLLLVAEDIFKNVPLAQTLARAEFRGFTAEDVASLAEAFGKFLSQVNKGRAKAEPRISGDTGFLCGLEPPRDEVLRMATAARRYRECLAAGKTYSPRAGEPTLKAVKAYLDGLDLAYVDADAPPVIIPEGYEPSRLGRNVVTSLAALVNTKPSAADVDRYWVRTYTKPTAVLTAEHLYLVRWLAAHDLGAKLDELGPGESHLAGLLVKAHDMLEQYRLDAVAAAAQLTGDGAAGGDIESLTAAVSAISWVNQAAAERVTGVLEAVTRDPGNARLRSTLATRLRAAGPSWAGNEALADIKYLNLGHVMLLCDRAGLVTDTGDERKAREQIRARLVELGLGADLDRELPAGLDAWRAGTLEEFYASRELAAANPWDAALDELGDELADA